MAPTASAPNTAARGAPRASAPKGTHAAARSEPSETNRVVITTTRNTGNAASVASGTRRNSAPSPVATPLPPRKPRKMDQQLPATAATAPMARAPGAAAPGPPTAEPPGARHGDPSLGDVTEQRNDTRQTAGGAQHVGGADVAAALTADVGDPEQPSDQITHRDSADDVRGRGREDDHDQRSSSGTMARYSAFPKKRYKWSTAEPVARR